MTMPYGSHAEMDVEEAFSTLRRTQRRLRFGAACLGVVGGLAAGLALGICAAQPAAGAALGAVIGAALALALAPRPARRARTRSSSSTAKSRRTPAPARDRLPVLYTPSPRRRSGASWVHRPEVRSAALLFMRVVGWMAMLTAAASVVVAYVLTDVERESDASVGLAFALSIALLPAGATLAFRRPAWLSRPISRQID
jgi:hypothetical protein